MNKKSNTFKKLSQLKDFTKKWTKKGKSPLKRENKSVNTYIKCSQKTKKIKKNSKNLEKKRKQRIFKLNKNTQKCQRSRNKID